MCLIDGTALGGEGVEGLSFEAQTSPTQSRSSSGPNLSPSNEAARRAGLGKRPADSR